MKNSICHIKNYLVRQNKESLSSDTNLWEYFSQTKKKKGKEDKKNKKIHEYGTGVEGRNKRKIPK